MQLTLFLFMCGYFENNKIIERNIKQRGAISPWYTADLLSKKKIEWIIHSIYGVNNYEVNKYH